MKSRPTRQLSVVLFFSFLLSRLMESTESLHGENIPFPPCSKAMTITALEELPLIRAKQRPIGGNGGTGPDIGPGSYNIDFKNLSNVSYAPFNTTSERPFLSRVDTSIPGPGSYSIVSADAKKGLPASAFASESNRFPLQVGDEIPGPGSYDIVNRWPGKKNPRTHRFRNATDGAPCSGTGTGVGPGCYEASNSTATRAKPRVPHFGRYAGRGAVKPNGNPGPGAYQLDQKPASLYATKPSSCFVTKATGGRQTSLNLPGPGSYEIPSCFQGRVGAEVFSAFGSSAPRQFAGGNSDFPGPGEYTKEIAPRRFYPSEGVGTAAFASTSSRLEATNLITPGPGAYDGNRPPKHRSYGGEAPFNSTARRFQSPPGAHLAPAEVDMSRTMPLRFPRRTAPYHSHVSMKIASAAMDDPQKGLCYDVNYDWPKPTSTAATTFGAAPRLPAADRTSDTPGPGHYYENGGPNAWGASSLKSNWTREVRFQGTRESGVPGPGRYLHNGTLLKKSFNVTIGADAMWQD